VPRISLTKPIKSEDSQPSVSIFFPFLSCLRKEKQQICQRRPLKARPLSSPMTIDSATQLQGSIFLFIMLQYLVNRFGISENDFVASDDNEASNYNDVSENVYVLFRLFVMILNCLLNFSASPLTTLVH
jgi:hypothetical protein